MTTRQYAPQPHATITWRRRIVLVSIAILLATSVAYFQYHWSIDMMSTCYDAGPAERPEGLNGPTYVAKGLVSAIIWMIVVGLAIVMSVPKRILAGNTYFIVAIATLVLVSLGLFWLGMWDSTITSDRCPTGIPPSWPTWLPL